MSVKLDNIILILILIIGLIIANAPNTKIIPTQVSYQESYQTPYQSQYTESYQEPYNSPIYSISYYGILYAQGYSDAVDFEYNIINATEIEYIYDRYTLNKGKMYNVKVITKSKYEQNTLLTDTYNNVYRWNIQTKSVLQGYETKYETKYRIAYKTSYKTEYRTSYRIENKYITKTNFEWLFNL